MNKKLNEEIDFVARHYEPGAFNASEALKSMGMRRVSFLRRYAAAAAAIAVLSAAAALFYFHSTNSVTPTAPVEPYGTESSIQAAPKTAVIDLENASLQQIVYTLQTTYGITIENVPQGDYNLTIHFEGTAPEAIDIVNSLLGTEMTIKK